MKIITTIAICFTLILGLTGNAAAFEIKSRNDKAKVNFYGQVNRVGLYVNDGNTYDVFSADNDQSSSRIGFKAKAKKGDLTIGSKVEVQIESDSTSSLNMNGGSSQAGGIGFSERHINVYVSHPKFGKITIGQGDTASNGTSEVDLSGTSVAGNSDVELFAKKFLFFNDSTNAYSTVKVGDAFNNMDGLSRKDMFRYDTSTFGGLMLSVSAASGDGDDAKDLALRYSGKLGGAKIKAAASYVKYASSNASNDSQVSGSASILLPFGLNFTGAGGMTTFDAAGRDNATMLYAKIGYIAKIFACGSTAFAIDFAVHDNVKQNDDQASIYGAQVVQKVKSWSTEIFLGVRNYSLSRPGTGFGHVLAAIGGARIKF